MEAFDTLCRLAFEYPSKLPERSVMSFGRFLGRALFYCSPHYRRVALANLELAYGDTLGPKRRYELALASFENMGLTLMEAFYLPRLDERELRERIVIEGLENLHGAASRKKGVLVLTAHFGNWEVMSIAMGLMGYKGHAVVRPLDFKPLDLHLTRIRTSSGIRLIPKNRAMRRIFEALRRGELVGILLDQSAILREGVFIDFFGHRACTDKGMAALALKTGAAVVPMFCLRVADGRHRIVIRPEVEMQHTGDRTRDMEDNTALFTNAIEEMIRSRPDQWLWLHRRWKQKPYYTWPRLEAEHKSEQPPKGPRKQRTWTRS